MIDVRLVFWHWWACGALLLVVELLAPGMYFLWMAESAFITGAVLWLASDASGFVTGSEVTVDGGFTGMTI
mgnify:CR=1 FL=1